MHDILPYIHTRLNDALDGIPHLMPEIYLTGLFLLVLITGLVFTRNAGGICRILSVGGMIFVIAQDVLQYLTPGGGTIFNGMLTVHHGTAVFKLIIDVVAVLLLCYFAWDKQLRAHRKGLADMYAIVIASILGLHLMVMSVNLLSIYLSVEFVSLASYLMVGYKSEQGFSAGAGLKYVLFGAASSAVMLYGISLLYAFTGTTDLYTTAFTGQLLNIHHLSVAFAVILFFAGLGFKLSFVPMHFWVPDVYQGAATPVTAYLSTLPKIAAFAMLLNVFLAFVYNPFNQQVFDFRLFLSVVGLITMIAGNFAAVMQKNVKRMLAYSSIGHTGFALIAIICTGEGSVKVLEFYLAVYAVANVGALVLCSYFANTTGAEQLDDYKGLGFKLPSASVCFVIILISLTGLPVTAGFIGKVMVFQLVYQAYQQNHDIWLMLLMITGAVTTVVALFYYIKVPLYLFLRKSDDNHEYIISNQNLLIAAVIISVFLVVFGMFPDLLVKYL